MISFYHGISYELNQGVVAGTPIGPEHGIGHACYGTLLAKLGPMIGTPDVKPKLTVYLNATALVAYCQRYGLDLTSFTSQWIKVLNKIVGKQIFGGKIGATVTTFAFTLDPSGLSLGQLKLCLFLAREPFINPFIGAHFSNILITLPPLNQAKGSYLDEAASRATAERLGENLPTVEELWGWILFLALHSAPEKDQLICVDTGHRALRHHNKYHTFQTVWSTLASKVQVTENLGTISESPFYPPAENLSTKWFAALEEPKIIEWMDPPKGTKHQDLISKKKEAAAKNKELLLKQFKEFKDKFFVK